MSAAALLAVVLSRHCAAAVRPLAVLGAAAEKPDPKEAKDTKEAKETKGGRPEKPARRAESKMVDENGFVVRNPMILGIGLTIVQSADLSRLSRCVLELAAQSVHSPGREQV